MTTTDDLELLEEYLDGEVEPEAAVALRGRLASDAELSAMLAKLRSQRELRRAAFHTVEGNELDAQQLMWRVRGAMLDQQRKTAVPPRRAWSQWRIASVGSAAAACMALGFLLGRFGHDRFSPASPSLNPDTVATLNAHREAVADNHSSGFVPVGAAPRMSVPITNEYGQVVAWQTFDNPEQAKNFTEDLNKTHGASQPPASAAQPRLVDSPQPPAQVPF